MAKQSPLPGEFDIIAQYFAPLAADAPGALGLQDDAAVISLSNQEQLITTTDTMIAGVHFFDDAAPEEIASKLLAINVSDLAAMGASPMGYLLAAAFTSAIDDTWLAGFVARLGEDQHWYGMHLLGGDTVSTPGPLTLTITALGRIVKDQVLTRSAAQPGDQVYVSGTIGDSALGLALLKHEISAIDDQQRQALIDRYRRPQPRFELGQRLFGVAHAVTDVSDGLVADLNNICESSGVGAVLKTHRVPLSEAASAIVEANASLMTTMLTGGDDYELIFTAPGESVDEIDVIARELNLNISHIGDITDGHSVTVFDAENQKIDLETIGYQHF